MEFFTSNWEYFLAAFYGLEKIVKLTPAKHDDIVVDMIGRFIFQKPKQ